MNWLKADNTKLAETGQDFQDNEVAVELKQIFQTCVFKSDVNCKCYSNHHEP